MVENFSTDYTKVENDGCTFALTATRCASSGLTRTTNNAYVYKDFGVGGISGDFEWNYEVYIDECGISAEKYYRCLFVILTNALGDFESIRRNTLTAGLYLDGFTGGPYLKAVYSDGLGGQASGAGVPVNIDTLYYITATRSGASYSVSIYSDSGRKVLVGTTSVAIGAADSWRYLMPIESLDLLYAYVCDSYIQKLDIGARMRVIKPVLVVASTATVALILIMLCLSK